MTAADALSWLAVLTSLAGVYFYGKKHKAGPWIGIASQVPWFLTGVYAGLTGMIASCVAFGGLHVKALYEWHYGPIPYAAIYNRIRRWI